MRTAALVAACLGASSAAGADELPTIEAAFGPALKIQSRNGAVVTRVRVREGEVTWVELSLVEGPHSYRSRGEDAELAIDLPPQVRVLGLELDHEGAVDWATGLYAAHGASAYTHAGSPALLDADGSSGGVAHYVLRVGNVTHAPTRIALALGTAEPIDLALLTDPTGATAAQERRQGAGRANAAVTVETRVHLPGGATAASRVDRERSLFADGGGHRGPIEIRFGGWAMTQPSLDKAIIRREIKAHREAVGYCYQRRLLQRPRLAGDETLHFAIEEDGTVSDASADGTDDDELHACLAAEVRTWRFPEARGGLRTWVNYPFRFRSSEV